MTRPACPECATRRKHLAESQALYAAKVLEHTDQPAYMLDRLLGSYRHRLKQARENLERHAEMCAATSEKHCPRCVRLAEGGAVKTYMVVLERELTQTALLYIDAESPADAHAQAVERSDEAYWSAPGVPPDEEIPFRVDSVTEAL